jgi:rare lipoprotein A
MIIVKLKELNPQTMFNIVLILFFSLFLAACGTKSRYSMEHDIGPKGDFDTSGVPDAVPVWEPLSRQGNRSPYTVRGIKYHIADISNGFEELGYASWYGLKFHGELTSNGEVYNMYAMSAAHKNLPIPSYVRVTNLDNNKQVIVRVNDRGPFHKGRVIDLSYAAATKLGYANKGTARVKVELIRQDMNTTTNTSVKDGLNVADKIAHFIQVGAFASKSSAENMLSQLKIEYETQDAFVASAAVGGSVIHRVRIGPFYNENEAVSSLKKIRSNGFSGAQIIQRAISAKNI